VKKEKNERYTYTKAIPPYYKPSMVRADPNALPEERETVILFNHKDDRAQISSGQKSIIRYLLAHPHFQVEEVTWFDDKIIAVSGTITKNCILITSRPRKKFSAGFYYGRIRKR